MMVSPYRLIPAFPIGAFSEDWKVVVTVAGCLSYIAVLTIAATSLLRM